MKLYLSQNVFDAALDRIRRLYDEFEHIVVNMSGGKDSTVVMHLALIVAEEKNRLPLKVMWVDQEAEWKATVNYIRAIKDDPRIDFDWLQVPFRIFNAASNDQSWLHCWKPGDTWIRPKEPDSIHENIYGVDRFGKLLDHYHYITYPEGSIAITGVRAAESPARARGLTTYATYKDITWGSKNDLRRGYYKFHPIYDWEISDVWKAIHEYGWAYNRLYDYMYQYGVPTTNMRVSNVTHETALHELFFLQEIEPETWEKITLRVQGANTVGQMTGNFFIPKTLPFMFDSWLEYRDYLLDHLIEDDAVRTKMRKIFAQYMKMTLPVVHDRLIKVQIQSILVNDYHGTKLTTWMAANTRHVVNRGKISGRIRSTS